jgi:hypothetical protein
VRALGIEKGNPVVASTIRNVRVVKKVNVG